MSVRLQPIQQLNKRAEEALVKEIGIVDTLRFLSQFRTGSGDYAADRKTLFEGLSVKDIVREIKDRR
jgi:hypothetical protein